MWLNAVLFQLGWFVCVLERGVLAVAAAALIVGIHLYRQRNQRWEWTAIAVISLIGIAQDTALIQLGVLQFDGSALPPAWMFAMWVLFATTLNHSLSWLQQRWWLAVLLGAISGPLSYLAGERLGALSVNRDLLPILSVTWAVSMPLLMQIVQRMKEPMPSCNA